MTDVAVRVEGISKRYRLGVAQKRADTFAEAVTEWVKRPLRNLHDLRSLSKFGRNGDDLEDSEDVLWALRDISFEVKQGEFLWGAHWPLG